MVFEEVHRLENRLRLAMMRSDLAELDELLADDFVFVSQNGQLMTKNDDLAIHRSGQQVIEALDISDLQITATDSTAIVVLKAIVRGHVEEQSFAGAFRYSHVWLKREGNWKITNAHCSLAEPELR